ncbi:MAG: hypothetical protein N4A47_04520 [Clostridia bacterium]|jgi:hypothetical protein|nr:hypothetical protein [Clostridia bacterium]
MSIRETLNEAVNSYQIDSLSNLILNIANVDKEYYEEYYGGFDAVDQMLTNPEKYLNELANIQKALELNGKNFVNVTRGATKKELLNNFNIKDIDDLKSLVGKSAVIESFMSTSKDKLGAMNFMYKSKDPEQRVLMNIRGRVKSMSLGTKGTEEEILIASMTEMKINSVKVELDSSGKPYYVVDVTCSEKEIEKPEKEFTIEEIEAKGNEISIKRAENLKKIKELENQLRRTNGEAALEDIKRDMQGISDHINDVDYVDKKLDRIDRDLEELKAYDGYFKDQNIEIDSALNIYNKVMLENKTIERIENKVIFMKSKGILKECMVSVLGEKSGIDFYKNANNQEMFIEDILKVSAKDIASLEVGIDEALTRLAETTNLEVEFSHLNSDDHIGFKEEDGKKIYQEIEQMISKYTDVVKDNEEKMRNAKIEEIANLKSEIDNGLKEFQGMVKSYHTSRMINIPKELEEQFEREAKIQEENAMIEYRKKIKTEAEYRRAHLLSFFEGSEQTDAQKKFMDTLENTCIDNLSKEQLNSVIEEVRRVDDDINKTGKEHFEDIKNDEAYNIKLKGNQLTAEEAVKRVRDEHKKEMLVQIEVNNKAIENIDTMNIFKRIIEKLVNKKDLEADRAEYLRLLKEAEAEMKVYGSDFSEHFNQDTSEVIRKTDELLEAKGHNVKHSVLKQEELEVKVSSKDIEEELDEAAEKIKSIVGKDTNEIEKEEEAVKPNNVIEETTEIEVVE